MLVRNILAVSPTNDYYMPNGRLIAAPLSALTLSYAPSNKQ
jgi:hypothetical protein